MAPDAEIPADDAPEIEGGLALLPNPAGVEFILAKDTGPVVCAPRAVLELEPDGVPIPAGMNWVRVSLLRDNWAGDHPKPGDTEDGLLLPIAVLRTEVSYDGGQTWPDKGWRALYGGEFRHSRTGEVQGQSYLQGNVPFPERTDRRVRAFVTASHHTGLSTIVTFSFGV